MTRSTRKTAPHFELNLSPRALEPVRIVSETPAATSVLASASLPLENMGECAGSDGGLSDDAEETYGLQLQGARRSDCFQATKIIGKLYLGSYADALAPESLRSRGITRILNVASECSSASNENGPFLTKHVSLRDHSDEDIATYFQECNEFIHEGLQRGEGVLVHCRMGVSRSATIVMAYLMVHGLDETRDAPCPYDQVLAFVKSRRPQVSPNLGFVLALHELNEQNSFEREDSGLDTVFQYLKSHDRCASF